MKNLSQACKIHKCLKYPESFKFFEDHVLHAKSIDYLSIYEGNIYKVSLSAIFD